MSKELETISSVLSNLKDVGEYNEFTVDAEGIVIIKGKQYTPHEVNFIKTYRLAGQSDVADEAIIYVVITCDGTTAFSLDADGLYAEHLDHEYAELIRSVPGNHFEKTIAKLVCTQLHLEKRNKRLKTVNEDLNNFVHTASHDLLAPLANIEMSIRLMAEPELTAEELKDYLRIMQVSIRKFRELVVDISSIGVIEGDMLTLQSVDVKEMIGEVEWSLNTAIEKEQAVISKNIEVHYLMFSRKNLRSILYNLVSNAIKFHNGTPPLIKIEVKRSGKGVKLSVEDNGVGIPQANMDRIFGLYGRLHHQVEGKGIGLYLAKKIIDSIEGSITVESEVNKGARFTLFFPNASNGQ